MAQKKLEDLEASYWIYEAYNGKKAILMVKGSKTFVFRNSEWVETAHDIYSDEYGEYHTAVKYEDIKSLLV